MTKLVLGVDDIAYSEPGRGPVTTGQVAEILEEHYQVFQIFVQEHYDEIGEYLAQAIADQIADLAAGAPLPRDPFLDAEQRIEALFRNFLETGEIESIHPDLPSFAALAGKSRRFKSGYGPERPSLIDTGQFMRSMRAVMED